MTTNHEACMRGVILAAFAIMISATPAQADRAIEDGQIEAAVRAEYDTSKLDALEAGVLANSQARAHRDGPTLILKTAGKPVVFTNNDNACEPGPKLDTNTCYGATLVADLRSRSAYLVAESHYEGGDFALVDDRTGATTSLSSVPRFSPNGHYLFIVNDSESDSEGGTIQIWERHVDRFERVWLYDTSTVGKGEIETTFRGWDGEGVYLDMKPVSQGRPAEIQRMKLTREPSGWRLVPLPKASGI